MKRLSYPLLALLAHWFKPQYNARLQFLEVQLQMLRSRLDTNRIVPSEQEKDELLRLGAQLDHDVGDLMHVVRPKTYRNWLNRRRGLRRVRRTGRPRMPVALRHLIERIGEGNPTWGYRRIVGELKKLGFRIGATTVRTILREADIPAGPETPNNQASIPWRTFIHANLDSIVASDFFTKKIYTPHGVITDYFDYYNRYRVHQSLEMDAPAGRTTQAIEEGNVVAAPHVGGLHHHYERKAA